MVIYNGLLLSMSQKAYVIFHCLGTELHHLYYASDYMWRIE